MTKTTVRKTSKREHRVSDRGTYVLILFLPRTQTIRVGRLGAFKFPRGYYIYVGSAMNGLVARLARHLRADKKPFWHIDHILQYARVKEVWTHQGDERLECVWARAAVALPRAKIIAPRFGASDCDCAAHLVYSGRALPKLDEG